MDPIPMPAPYLGVNDKIPKIALQSPYAQKLHNFNVTQEGVTLRHGDEYVNSTPTGFWILELLAYGSGNGASDKLIAVVSGITNTYVYNAETGVSEGSWSLYYSGSMFFNKNLFVFGTVDSFVYDGSAWGVVGYTGSGLLPYGGTPFKNRAYIIQGSESAYWYSNLYAITGALHKVDLSTIVSEACTLSAIAPISIADNTASVTLLAFVFSSGEVLFFSGSYPDAADWALASRAKIGQPLTYNSFINYQGDSLVYTETGLVSLRDLFLKGSEGAVSLSVNSNIQKQWKALVAGLRAETGIVSGPISIPAQLYGKIKGAWDETGGRIIVSFPGYIDDSGDFQWGSTYFVFDTELKAWSTQRSVGADSAGTAIDRGIRGIVYYKNQIYCAARAAVWIKEGADGFTDRDRLDASEVGYLYEIISAPVANGRAYVQRCTGLDAILETDLNEENNWLLIRDFGNETTTTQQVTVGTGLQKPFINIGIEGSYIQWWLIGTTTSGKTVGLDLYGINFWVEGGGSPR
jgi:hypothetical protein